MADTTAKKAPAKKAAASGERKRRTLTAEERIAKMEAELADAKKKAAASATRKIEAVEAALTKLRVRQTSINEQITALEEEKAKLVKLAQADADSASAAGA